MLQGIIIIFIITHLTYTSETSLQVHERWIYWNAQPCYSDTFQSCITTHNSISLHQVLATQNHAHIAFKYT